MGTVGVSTKMALSLSSPTGMFLALLSIVELESNGRGYTVGTLFDTEMVPGVQNGHCLGYSMAMLFVDGILYVVATWILDQYLRSEFGQNLSMKQIAAQLDCCWVPIRDRLGLAPRRRSPGGGGLRYKALSEQTQSENARFLSHSDGDSESVDLEMGMGDGGGVSGNGQSAECSKTVSIEIVDLSKVYGAGNGAVVAVDGLTMDIFEGECCALLGPNGAGKSTMIVESASISPFPFEVVFIFFCFFSLAHGLIQNVLTGMVEATSGSARIGGYSVRREMHHIRRSLGVGVCPQHSTLWPMLTVHEHLYLFAALKELDPSSMEQDIDRLLRDVTLSEKKGAFSSTLSGGQRRKLSVAIALIGDPQIIFLDEPTSLSPPPRSTLSLSLALTLSL